MVNGWRNDLSICIVLYHKSECSSSNNYYEKKSDGCLSLRQRPLTKICFHGDLILEYIWPVMKRIFID